VTTSDPIRVAVLLPDPHIPYDFGIDGRLGEEDLEAARRLEAALGQLEGYRCTTLDRHEAMIPELAAGKYDLALNFCDTGYKNDGNFTGHLPSLCDLLGVGWTGSPAVAIDAAADKALVRALAIDLKIPVPAEELVDLTAEPFPAPREYPALIKPNVGGGSYGVTQDCVVRDAAAAEAYLRELAGSISPPEAVIQEFLTGPEYTVAVVDDPARGLTVLPPTVVDYSGLDPELPPVFTFGAKYDPESPYWRQVRHRRAEVDEATLDRLRGASLKLFTRLRCFDYARFDYRCGADGVPRLLDANPNPTWHWDGRVALAASWGGYDYPALLRLILDSAAIRHGLKPRPASAGA